MISGMSSLGLAIAGPPVDHFGVKIWFLIGGIVTTILGIVPFFVPVIMDVEMNETMEGKHHSWANDHCT
jgi:DHA3 family macrolide efflux protein-like MFS transporter